MGNSLQPVQQQKAVIEYDCNGQNVKLSPQIVRNYLVNGNGNITDQEIVLFMNLCRYQGLNPFLKEVHLIKYGSSPATMVVGKEAFEKRARRNKSYAGKQAGVVVCKADGTLENRIGSIVLDDETLVGGWAKVFIKGDEVPAETSVMLKEYMGKKSDGTVNSNWAMRPATMIRKVALVHALREAFPEDFVGLYSQDEMGVDVVLSDEPIVVNDAELAQTKPDPLAD